MKLSYAVYHRTLPNDTFMEIVQTAKKLGVSSYEYIHDRVSNSFCMPSFSELIFVVIPRSSAAIGTKQASTSTASTYIRLVAK